jgi:DNA-binding FadR family transcriptional regulator
MIALETLGLIEVRVGDGTYVRDPGALWTAPRADLGPGPLEQFEARRAIEPECAALAASAATPAQLGALADSLARIEADVGAGRDPSPEHARFHTLLAEAAGNAILASVARELWRLRGGALWETLRRRVDDPGSFAKGIAFRRRLIACLRAHDARGARAAMQAHLDRVGKLYFGPDEPARARRSRRPR